MILLHQWNIFLHLVTTAVATGNTFSGNEKDIIDAKVGESFKIRTWPFNGSRLFIAVKKGNNTRFSTSLDENVGNDTTVQDNRIVLKYNHTQTKFLLMFENVSKEDEGLYEIEVDAYERIYGTWDLEINVLEPGEVKECHVGENISLEFGKSLNQSFLYYYDKKVAVLSESVCGVLEFSRLYNRLSCTSNELNTIYRITINNITQRDAGLYKVATGRDESERYFLNIKDGPTFAFVGDNMTIRWFYNQQGIKRTLRVIHPDQGVMMLLPLTNVPQINSNFQHRLLYSGNISESFMQFVLLNLRQSDAGLYTIETLHGNAMPGGKELIVKVTCTTTISTPTTVPLSAYPAETPSNDITTDTPYSKHGTVIFQQMERQYIANTSTTSTVKLDTSVIMVSHYTPTNSPKAQKSTVRAGVPLQVAIPVVTATVGVIMAMIGCLIWLQRKNSYTLKAVQRLVLEKCDTTSIATPSTIRRPPPMPPREEEWTSCPAPESNALCNAVLSLPYSPTPTASTLVGTAWYSTFSLSDLEHDKPSDNFILNVNGSNERTDENISVACDENTNDSICDSCPSVCTSSIAKHTCNRIADGNDQRHVSERVQVMYAEVKKRPKCSSTNTTTGGTDSLCWDGYEMVDISRDFDLKETLKDDSKASESAIGQTPSCHGHRSPRNEFVDGANEDDGYESVENVMDMRSAGNIKNEDAMATKDREPKQQTKNSGNTYNDYAGIDL